MDDEKVWQEFFCNECVGYFRIKLCLGYDHSIHLHCPNCDHLHHRVVEDGRIKERFMSYNNPASGLPADEIFVAKSAYSKEPWTAAMEKRQASLKSEPITGGKIWDGAREGAEIKSQEDLIPNPFFRERWLETYGAPQ